jgi:hypothetical protein
VAVVLHAQRRVSAVARVGLRRRARGEAVAYAGEGLDDPRIQRVEERAREIDQIEVEARRRLVHDLVAHHRALVLESAHTHTVMNKGEREESE